MKFSEALESFLNFQQAISSSGNYGYLNSKIKTINKFMGTINVNSIDRSSGTDFIRKLRERNPSISESTINKYIDIIKRVLKVECDIKFSFSKLKENKKVFEVVPDEVVPKDIQHYRKNLNHKHRLKKIPFCLGCYLKLG